MQRSAPISLADRPRLVLLPAREHHAQGTDAQYRVLLAGAVLVGVVVRVMTVMASSFPLNDGGMFYAMVRDIQASSYRLPAYTSYNGEHIPFFYPPLGFYFAALLSDLTPLSLADALRVLPLAFSLLAIGAFFLLAQDLLENRAAVVASVLFFGVVPPAFYWMIMGGGLTRAPGFFFALLTIREARRMYLDPRPRRVGVVGALAALTLLTHIEMAVLAAIACAVMLMLAGPSKRRLASSLCVGALTFALSSPWWWLVLRAHGLAPLDAAISTTGSSLAGPLTVLSEFSPGVPPLVDVIGGLALLGIVASLRQRRYVLPAWILAVAVLDQRAFFTSAIAPLAMLAGVGLVDVVLPMARGAMEERPARPDEHGRQWLPGAVLGVVVAVSVVAALISSGKLEGLDGGERSAMAWVATNTPASSRFAILSGQTWPVDRNSEWFPALAERQSVATVQGTEWLPGVFNARRSTYLALQECANSDGDCLARWASSHHATFDYVYVLKSRPGAANGPLGASQCCRDLALALRKDARYVLVYDGAGATIFKRLS